MDEQDTKPQDTESPDTTASADGAAGNTETTDAMAENAAAAAYVPNSARDTAIADFGAAAGIEPGSGRPNDAELSPLAKMAAQGLDPSDTYTHGAVGGSVNTAVPEGARVVTDYYEAMDAGYFGYAPGAAAHDGYTVQAAGKKNDELAAARRASINRSAEAEEADVEGKSQKARARTRTARATGRTQ